MDKSMSHIEYFERNINPSDNRRHLKALELRSFYETLAVQLFNEFEPTKNISTRLNRDFILRLDQWLDCFTSEEDRWIAFQSLEYFFFAGNKEFEELYRCAFEQRIKPWLVDNANIDIFSERAGQQIRNELDRTWPCPITDSLRINGFLHVTGMKGQSLRPDWQSLKKLGCTEKIKKYVAEKDIKYLVLLEDFSGSGGQIIRNLKFVSDNFNGPILLVPLIICATGDKAIREKLSKLPDNISYSPVTVISYNCLVSEFPSEGEPPIFRKLRIVMKNGYELINEVIDGDQYGWEKTGSLFTMYSNCPNNTPPIYHYQSPSWNPLFPRSDRETR